MKVFSFIFPGQGAQSPNMGGDLYNRFACFRECVEEASTILRRDIAYLLLRADARELSLTANAQVALFVHSAGVLRVLSEQCPYMLPSMAGGLSLGEYNALLVSRASLFSQLLPLVEKRGVWMQEAVLSLDSSMAAVLGLDVESIRECLDPKECWIANLNCPGQVVLSGTQLGLENARQKCVERGARRFIPLRVAGGFHSPLMQSAQDALRESIEMLGVIKPLCSLYMNVTGAVVSDPTEIKRLLIDQIVSPVLWEKSIHNMRTEGAECFIEIGNGTVLNGFCKKMGYPCVSIGKEADLEQLSNLQTVGGLV
jgi:[acyl-carrier-protein] S-malonyltransferase